MSSQPVSARRMASLLAPVPSARRHRGAASAADTWIGHYWQGSGLRNAPGARSRQRGVKPPQLVSKQAARVLRSVEPSTLPV